MVSTNALPFALVQPLLLPAHDIAAQIGELQHAVTVASAEIRKLQQESDALRAILGGLRTLPSPAEVEPSQPSTMQVRLFGSLRVAAAGRGVECKLSRKARLLFAYLASEPRKRSTKEMLTETFWGDCPASRGPNNLSIAVYQIRAWLRELGDGLADCISVKHGVYSFGDECWWIDTVEFSNNLVRAREAIGRGEVDRARALMDAAVELYAGEFLSDEAYEDWAAHLRRVYAGQLTMALRWLVDDAAAASDWQRVADYARRIVSHDDCDEAGYRWLMVANWKLGDRAKALLLYRQLRERLETELGIAPSRQTQEVFRVIVGEVRGSSD